MRPVLKLEISNPGGSIYDLPATIGGYDTTGLFTLLKVLDGLDYWRRHGKAVLHLRARQRELWRAIESKKIPGGRPPGIEKAEGSKPPF